MHKTIYIDVDEEITNILDKIRREQAEEIFLVVPKGAMLIQGVINLKVLKREVEKMGKSIMVVTNDAQAKKVIRQIGIKIKESMDAGITNPNQRNLRDQALSARATDQVMDKLAEDEEGDEELANDSEIGSSSFYEQGQAKQNQAPTGFASNYREEEEDDDYDDEYEDDNEEEEMSRQMPQRMNQPLPPVAPAPRPRRLAQRRVPPALPLEQTPQVTNSVGINRGRSPIGVMDGADMDKGMEEEAGFERQRISQKASSFFSKIKRSGEPEEEQSFESRKRTSDGDGVWGGVWKWIIIIGIIMIALGGFGVWAYFNYPKVNIVIHAASSEVETKVSLIAKDGAQSVDVENGENVIPGEYIELSVEHKKDFEATGEDFISDDGKAKGMVTIYNKYSSQPQPLVASTRILSESGKLFRLASSVTVPAMKGETPGEVEVKVAADKSGEEFNIEPTTFTIEGFKNNTEKYEKFEVVSDAQMQGGGTPDESKKRTVVSAEDLESARKKTMDDFDSVLEEKVAEELGSDKKVLVNSITSEVEKAFASHQEKDIADKFTYTVVQKVKAIAFSQDDVKTVAIKKLNEEMEEGYALEEETGQISFKKGTTNFENKTLSVELEASAVVWPQINDDAIKKGIAGKKEDDIKGFLSKYPSIKRAEINFKPFWLVTVPDNSKKIQVEIKRGE